MRLKAETIWVFLERTNIQLCTGNFYLQLIFQQIAVKIAELCCNWLKDFQTLKTFIVPLKAAKTKWSQLKKC